jgi:DNA-binding MarR family transcriptional regulator
MPNAEQQLRILEALEEQPETTQAGLAAQLGVAVGTVNWYLKRLMRKGYVKTSQLERRNLKYFVTPSGLALKARLTKEYLDASLRVYRRLHQTAQETLARVTAAGYDRVTLDREDHTGRGAGSNGAWDIFRLTCLEQGVTIDDAAVDVPRIGADGRSFAVTWPSHSEESRSKLRGSS